MGEVLIQPHGGLAGEDVETKQESGTRLGALAHNDVGRNGVMGSSCRVALVEGQVLSIRGFSPSHHDQEPG